VLPLRALRTQASVESATVLVVDAGRAQERKVRLGLRSLSAAEVIEGLSEGDQVLLGGTIKAGDRVRAQATVQQADKPGAPNAGREDAGSAMTNALGR
jgi:HlyD family secretion protein